MNLQNNQADNIVKLFKEEAGSIWNDGKFSAAVEKYCADNQLDFNHVHKKLEIAFRDVLATNITSENAIRFRLKNPIPNNAAL